MIAHPSAAELQLARSPLRFDGAAERLDPPPLLGQHTAEVLGELGFDADELIAAGVAAAPEQP